MLITILTVGIFTNIICSILWFKRNNHMLAGFGVIMSLLCSLCVMGLKYYGG